MFVEGRYTIMIYGKENKYIDVTRNWHGTLVYKIAQVKIITNWYIVPDMK